MTPAPFPRFAYEEAMRRYGTDKPDLRNPLEIASSLGCSPRPDSKPLPVRLCRAIRIPEGAKQSRSFFDKLEERAKTEGAAGLAWLLVEAGNSLKGPITKFLEPEEDGADHSG